jgi:2-oxoglutarate ferredoxin oxidoreductase subunit alpha
MTSEGDTADVIVIMNHRAWEDCRHSLKQSSVIVYEDSLNLALATAPGYAIPAMKIATDIAWPRGKNFALLGALVWFFQLGLPLAEQLVQERMWRHPESLAKNLEALRQGYAYAQRHYPGDFPYTLPIPEICQERLILTGADAIALGAVAAGCTFYAGYPITPATTVMEALARHLQAHEGVLIQAEDEIAAINMSVGAAFAGRRVITTTSGPGLSLMIETLGLASMIEVPVVIVDVQRGGPSTGLPTKTSQGDLLLALYGSHGEAPRIVLAPDSVEDCYYQTRYAFELADYYQTPVILLCDQALVSHLITIPSFNDRDIPHLARLLPEPAELASGYRRYRLTESGISPIAIPGMPDGMYQAESVEHDEAGLPNQSPENHEKMMRKRARKLELVKARREMGTLAGRRWGPAGAPWGIIGWGSTRGVVSEAMAQLQSQGIEMEALYLHSLCPLPDAMIRYFLTDKRAVLVPELNFSGQFKHILTYHFSELLGVGKVTLHSLPKEQGIPFKVQEIYEAALGMVSQVS